MIHYRTLCFFFACFFIFAPSSSQAVDFIPGDFDRDGIVDVQDAAIWAATYGSTNELFADANQNGIVDQGDYDILYENFGRSELLAARAFGIAASAAENTVDIVYDPNSGEVILDPSDSSGSIAAFKLITTDAFNQGVANAPFQRFVADPNSFLPDGDTFIVSETQIGQIDIHGSGLPEGGFNFGPILPTGLSLGDVQAQLSGSQILGASGSDASFGFVQVPEPGTLCGAMMLGGVLLLMGRRLPVSFE